VVDSSRAHQNEDLIRPHCAFLLSRNTVKNISLIQATIKANMSAQRTVAAIFLSLALGECLCSTASPQACPSLALGLIGSCSSELSIIDGGALNLTTNTLLSPVNISSFISSMVTSRALKRCCLFGIVSVI
jgi:hypothetical protein